MTKKLFLTCILFIIMALCACESKTPDDMSYLLTYSSEGAGFITCSYASGEEISKGTYVSIVASSSGEGKFIAWYKNGKEYSSNTNLNICMTSDICLEAKFSGTNYKDLATTKIKDLKEENVKVVGTIVNMSNNFYVVKDDTGSVLIQSFGIFSLGDVVLIEGIPTKENDHFRFYTDAFTIKVDNGTTSYETIELDLKNINKQFGIYTIISGTLYYEDYDYYIVINDTNYKLYLYDYDSSLLDEYIGFELTVKGHVLNVNDKIIDFMILSIGKISDDISTESNLIAYFDNNWKNVLVSFDGGAYSSMIKNGDYYFISLTSDIETVAFKTDTKTTETFNYDKEYNNFVLFDERFNGLYSGYFTTSDNIENDVKKITCLEMNDLHGYISQTNYEGGISNAAYIINEIRNENTLDDVLLIANGDMFQGTALSNLSYGESVVKAMSIMGFDMMGIGNHEFDWGLDKILKYFDGNNTNGEATFPLVNTNIVYKTNDNLVGIDESNIVNSLITMKNGVKIGIVSAIGDLSSSILYSRIENYTIKDAATCMINEAKKLKDQGCEIIIANLHEGDSTSVSNLSANKRLSLATYNDDYLFDAVINGHTHTNQSGIIERMSADMPITQAGSNCLYVGEIELYYDSTIKQVISSNITNYNVKSTAKSNFDEEVQDQIDDCYNDVKKEMEETYCVSGVNISYKQSLSNWMCSVIRKISGCEIGVMNSGGIRSTGNIYNGTKIGIENIYLIYPFDNEIVIVHAKGKDIYTFLMKSSSSIYYSFGTDLSLGKLKNNNEYYDIAVIDYVYYWSGFPKGDATFTKINLRDALIKDLKLRTSFDPINDYESKLSKISSN